MKNEKITAIRIFELAYGKHANFFTDNIEEMGLIRQDVVYELASGYILSDKQVFGVTVIEFTDKYLIKRFSLNRSFDTRQKAREYIEKLKNNYENMLKDVKENALLDHTLMISELKEQRRKEGLYL